MPHLHMFMHVCAVENCRRECFIDSGVYLKVEEEIPGKMSGKTVVLSYLGRNKKVFIPANETEGDFVFLRKKVIELFDFKCQRNVKLDITFQKHDDEVDEYIDIEKDEEDEVDKIQQKDKVKVIVTPSLTDDTPDGSTTAENLETPESTPVHDNPRHQLCTSLSPTVSVCSPIPTCSTLDDDDDHITSDVYEDMDDNDLLPSRKKLKVILDSDNESEQSFSVSVTKPSLEKTKESKFVVKKSMISKTEDENIPLPDPFELPKNFRPDVASALKLARSIVNRYPFMKSPTGKPYGAIVEGLKNRLKERRRVKKPRTPPPATKNFKSPIQKTPTVKAFGLPDVPPGEDAASFERHNRVLKAEFSKPSPNVANVKQLMEVTFPMRRREILSIGHTKDYHPFTKYPFLQIPSHILDEFSRITGEKAIADSCRRSWNEYYPKIVDQARMEKGTRVSNAITELLDDDEDKGNTVIALCLLTYLLPDSRTKPDPNKVIVFCQVSSNIQWVATSNQSEPFVIVVGDHKQNDQSFLVIDRKVVTETVIQDIPIILLAAFYMLNICYPSGLYNFYKFLELIFLNISHPIPPSVKILHTTLNAGTAKQ